MPFTFILAACSCIRPEFVNDDPPRLGKTQKDKPLSKIADAFIEPLLNTHQINQPKASPQMVNVMKPHGHASKTNREIYDSLDLGQYARNAPHLRHETIRKLYGTLVETAFQHASRLANSPVSVLDLGAGEGTVTKPFLELGANVLAVDVSERQLKQLRAKCCELPGLLEVKCSDIDIVLSEDRSFDIIVANSLLHHIPDYLEMTRRATARLTQHGVFICFQDPMFAPTISGRDALLSWIAYTVWRLRQGDVVNGVGRRLRRIVGIYSSESQHDNVEYHAVRNGVDQNAIANILSNAGFRCDIFKYCSFHSDTLQPFGERLNVKNTFGLIASRNTSHALQSSANDSIST